MCLTNIIICGCENASISKINTNYLILGVLRVGKTEITERSEIGLKVDLNAGCEIGPDGTKKT